eukprot:SAG31_NODE_10381_length_1145_cov_1.738050_1_plen_175_part_10
MTLLVSVYRADSGTSSDSVGTSKSEGNDADMLSENVGTGMNRSDVSDASASGLSDLVPFHIIGFIIILALLTRDMHPWNLSISSCMGRCQCGILPGCNRALQNNQGSRSVRHQRSNLSELLGIMAFYVLVFQPTFFVLAGETETQPIACESPHQVATVAQAVTDSCEEGGEDSGA